jgi:3',5'-cyclic-AMP phosphodiesterase
VLGNHDKFAAVGQYLLPTTAPAGAELYYAEEDVRFRYLFLDSSSGVIGPTQSAWLSTQLATDKSIVVFVHHPILPVDAPVDRLDPLKERDRVAALFRQHRRPVAIFCGQYHFTDEQTVGNITQCITPAASFQVKKAVPDFVTASGPSGYRVITLHETNVSSEIVWLGSP